MSKKNKNQSKLRFGSYKEREGLCTARMITIQKCRDQDYTWAQIGEMYQVSRQAAHKFYNENLFLIQ